MILSFPAVRKQLSWTWSQQYGSPLMLFSVAFWGFLLHSQGWTASLTTADSWLMPSVSLTLCLKSSCEVAALSLAVCPRDRPPKSEHWNDGCHKWRIPLLTPGDRSVRECRRTKCFTQNFPSGHVYKVHGHTHIWARDPAPSALLQNLGRPRYPEDFRFWAFEGCWAFVISLSYAPSVSSPAQLSKAHQFQDQTLLFLAPKAALAQPPML